MLNFDLIEANNDLRLQLSKLDEIRVEAYKSVRSYKKRNRLFYDKKILRKEFTP